MPLKDENTLDEQMGFVLVGLRLTLRNGDSKKGIVWETLTVVTACVAAVKISVLQ